MRFRKSLHHSRQVRHGFTLLELMVVFAVIGVLLALLLPAVQRVRESARASQCKNNMHQLGVALHGFESQHQTLPAGNDSANTNHHSWCTRILPFIDQAPLYQSYDWLKPWDDASSSTGMTNSAVTRTSLPIYLCPSEPMPARGDTNYGGNLGTVGTGLPIGFCYGDGWESGALTYINFPAPQTRTHPVSFGEFSDGLSQTFLVFEIAGRATLAAQWGNGGNCLGIQNPVNDKVMGETITSFHPLGGHALFADGRVAFISENSDLRVLQFLATRSRGEVAATEF